MKGKRRDFLKQLALLTSVAALPGVASGKGKTSNRLLNTKRVIVVGAGFAGLSAAVKLKSAGLDVIVLEARDRIGGRIWSDRSLGFPVDLGASWIHGPSNDNPVKQLSDIVDPDTFETDDESLVIYDNNGDEIDDATMEEYYENYNTLLEDISNYAAGLNEDTSVETAIQNIEPSYLSDLIMLYQLTSYMEFDSGGDIAELSSKYWENDTKFPGNDVLFPNGYDALTNYLAEGLDIRTEHIVSEIDYSDNIIYVTTNNGEFEADHVVVTLPLGVLKNESVEFVPELPTSKTELVDQVKVGYINKVFLSFDDIFWDEEMQYIGVTTDLKGKYPYFLNARKFVPVNGLMTFGFGLYGLTMESQTDEQIKDDVMAILKTIYGDSIPEPTGVVVSRWTQDEFAKGSYSFANIASSPEYFDDWQTPVDGKLFFAGEHTINAYRGTTHGAYISGENAADKILEIVTNIKRISTLPTGFDLQQNYPNPFNPSTTISYSLDKPGRARLEIFDITGRRVRTMVDKYSAAGSYSVIWDGNDGAGAGVASGVYVYRLTHAGTTISKKMQLVK